jgi:hypothetical protein
MKKLSLTLLILASIIHVLNGQIEKPIKKGTILLGGSFSINFEKEETKYLATVSRPARTSKTDIKTFETDAYFGYFLSDQVTFGLKTDIIFEQYKYPRTSYIEKEVNNFFYAGPFLRYYTKFGLFAEGSASIAISKIGWTEFPDKSTGYELATGIGYSIFLTNSVAIEPMIKYRYQNDFKPNEQGVKHTHQEIWFSLGFQIYLNH